MRVLGIGYGRHLFNKDNFEFERLQRCAGEVDSFNQIIFSKRSDGLEKVDAENNFTLHPTSSNSKWSMIFDAVEIGSNLIKEKDIEVITCQDLFETGLVGWLLKRRFPNVTLQVQEHGDVLSSKHWRRESFSNRLRYWFSLLLLKRVDVLRVVSKRTEEYLKPKLGKQSRICRLPVVIDTKSFSDSPAVRNTDKSKFTFITAARFVPQKNFPLLLNAFAEVYEEFPEARLRIFGEGPDKTDILVQIEQLELSNAVEVHPWTSNLAEEMSKADAYVLTSNYEGWGRVLIEAMLQRLPVVTTDVGCANEVLIDKTHGLVVPVDYTEALVEAMKLFTSRAPMYEEIKRNLSTVSVSSISGTNIETYAKQWATTLR